MNRDRIFRKGMGNMHKARGFTLIELMIVVTIVAILASIALPAYQDYITRSRIAEATSGLGAKRARIEAFYDNSHDYSTWPDCAADNTTSTSFTFSCVAASLTASTYTLQAVGRGPMTNFTFTINQNNDKATTSVPPGTAWATNNSCWVTRKGGVC